MKKKRKQRTAKQKGKDTLWELCKQIVRKRDGDSCVICPKRGLTGSNWHTGHLIPSSVCGAHLRFDLRNLHSNCYNCNINLGGNGAMYYRMMKIKYGEPQVEQLFKEQHEYQKVDVLFYNKLIAEYKVLLNLTQKQLQEHTRNLYEARLKQLRDKEGHSIPARKEGSEGDLW